MLIPKNGGACTGCGTLYRGRRQDKLRLLSSGGLHGDRTGAAVFVAAAESCFVKAVDYKKLASRVLLYLRDNWHCAAYRQSESGKI